MTSRLKLFFLALFSLYGFAQSTGGPEDHSLRFKTGEQLSFRLSYGWFTVGKANLDVKDSVYDTRECYKVNISGRTAGLVGVFAHVDDDWGAYITKDRMLPLMAYSDIIEGSYTRNERIYFDQGNRKIRVEMTKKGTKRPTKYYETEGDIHDLLSGYLYLRNLDYNSMKPGDTVRFDAYYDQIFYDFGILYEGKEMVDTEVGELYAHKVIPIIPENKIFPGENPITAWVSADLNQLPLMVEARMFFGKAYVELTDYKNLKYGPDFEGSNE
jgi:hypothetical protein